MKKTLVPFFVFALLSLGFAACHKDAQSIEPSSGNAVLSSNKPEPKAVNSALVPSSDMNTEILAKGKGGFKKKAKLDDKGFCDCTDPGSSCKVSKVMDDAMIVEIRILQTIIATRGNGNEYFNIPGWRILFEEVNETSGLLNDIRHNKVFLYQLKSAKDSGTRFGHSYVLSTAAHAAAVNDGNIEMVWQY